MSRSEYRHRVFILRRIEGKGTGGYGADPYEQIGETSCKVRDETENEWHGAESARMEHVRTFKMRPRDIREDDMLLWRGEAYRVRRVDGVFNLGRDIRVRASLSKSKYTIVG